MADATLTRFGADNGGATKDALFLKLFAGEVLASFNLANVFKDKHRMKSISGGKSYQ